MGVFNTNILNLKFKVYKYLAENEIISNRKEEIMENGKSIAFYLDESDLEKIETLKKALKLKNNSKLMRYLVQKEYHDYMQYVNGYDSNKQIINYSHSSRVAKKFI